MPENTSLHRCNTRSTQAASLCATVCIISHYLAGSAEMPIYSARGLVAWWEMKGIWCLPVCSATVDCMMKEMQGSVDIEFLHWWWANVENKNKWDRCVCLTGDISSFGLMNNSSQWQDIYMAGFVCTCTCITVHVLSFLYVCVKHNVYFSVVSSLPTAPALKSCFSHPPAPYLHQLLLHVKVIPRWC